MKLSLAQAGSRIFVLAFGAFLVFLAADTWVTSAPLLRATQMRLAEEGMELLPVPRGVHERSLVMPVAGIDGKWWVIHTENMLRHGGLRVRHSPHDNAPEGREVHWSSGLMWFLAVVAGVMHWWTGQPVLDAVATAAFYSGPLLLVLLSGAYGLIVKLRYGWAVATLGLLLFATTPPVFEFFRAGTCDHHGLVAWFGMVSVFCFAAAGAGFVSPPRSKRSSPNRRQGDLSCHAPAWTSARPWVVASGVAGGAGLWVSAATQIPVLAGLTIAGFIAAWFGRRSGDPVAVPRFWRTWGLAGGLTSLFFYLVEYFPGHLGWRLEVNHPLYALAWFGGALTVGRLVSAMTGGSLVRAGWADRAQAVLCLALALLPAFFIRLDPDRFFWVADRFLLALHNEHIGEFQPFIEAIQGEAMGIILTLSLMLPLFCLVALCLLLGRGGVTRAWVAPLLAGLIPTLLMLGLGLVQSRWMVIGLGLCSVFATILLACLQASWSAWPRWWRPVLGGALLLALLPLPVFTALKIRLELARPGDIPKDLLPNVIARDVCQRILRADPARKPVILSGPTTSTDIAFYGGIPVLGTLYWENAPGLKAAARIFSAPDADVALRELTDRGVTHILLFSWDEFSADYAGLWGLADGSVDEKNLFAARLLDGSEMPQWIRPLYYPIPSALGLETESVALFEIVPSQSRRQSLLAQIIFQIDASRPEAALSLLGQAEKEFPADRELADLRHRVSSLGHLSPEAWQ